MQTRHTRALMIDARAVHGAPAGLRLSSTDEPGHFAPSPHSPLEPSPAGDGSGSEASAIQTGLGGDGGSSSMGGFSNSSRAADARRKAPFFFAKTVG